LNVETRLSELSIDLPVEAAAGGKYAPATVHADLAYVSGQLPRDGDKVLAVGAVGRECTPADAKLGARLAFLRSLAALKLTLGSLDRVERVLKLSVFVHSAPDFTGHSAVADGASEVIYQLFGPERGAHARTSVGVAQLPRGGAVEVEVLFALNDGTQACELGKKIGDSRRPQITAPRSTSAAGFCPSLGC
jgi:enamine deaminase RidA (YjgF/YER057c/UK114 family)